MAAAEEPPLPDDNAPTSSGVLIASLLRYLEAADGEATVCFCFSGPKKMVVKVAFPAVQRLPLCVTWPTRHACLHVC